MKIGFGGAALAALMVVSPPSTAVSRAEVSELHMATQYGIGTLAMVLVERKQLLEKHLAQAGLAGTKVTWSQFPAGNPMNDGLLSGRLDIVSGGTTVFITLWGKTTGTPSAVRGVGAVSALPLYLLTRDPKVQKIEDLGPQDKIAVTTLKISVHAILLQMAAEKIWGNPGRLDPLTTQIPHGDAAAAMISGAGEINNHFSAPPFQELEMRAPGVRRISSQDEILGAPASYMVAYATERFRKENPKTYQAFVDALKEAGDMIKKDPTECAKIYLEFSKDKISLEDTVALIKSPGSSFDMTPQNVLTFARFMAQRGIIKTAPASWQDMFFPEVHNLPGS
jgi:NitT/TauT family transport system substrate-binding protein